MTIKEIERHIEAMEKLQSVEESIAKTVYLEQEIGIYKDYLKHKIVIKYFMENGKQETKDIIKNLLSY